jgi:outer membrane receptor protein involved in Fe transport
MSRIAKLLCVFMVVLGLSAVAMAQSTTTGAIGGVVQNPNKEVVPGAAVTVKNVDTNKEDSATTDDAGRFKVPNLQPGRYSVSVNAPGFTQVTQENVVVEVGRETPLEVGLSIGAVTGTVDVTAEAPVINTSQQDFSSNINQTSINELPINGRRWSNFALLTPGAVPDGTFGLISFRGISGLLNNNTIDGGDNNQAFFAEERGRTRISYSVSQAAIREFQVNTSSYSAEYGRSAGGVVNAVTKSGTNEFHGSAFYYQRNNKWGARNPLATRTQLINGVFTPVGYKPKDVRHQFGGTIGGPIVKDKAFFFFSYDQQKRNFPGLAIFGVNGYLNSANRSAITARGVTGAQIDSTLNFLNSITGPVPRTGDQKLFLPKVDWNINEKNTLTVVYNRLRWESPAGIQTQATNARAIDNFGDDFVRIDSLNVKLASTITPMLLNEFRYQWGRDNEFQFSQPPAPGEPTNSIGGRSPQTNLAGGNACFNPAICFGIPEFLERQAFPDERRHQFADTVTMTSGNHTIKFGGDVNFVKDIISNLRFGGGEFIYSGSSSLSDFIVDYVNWQTNGAIRALSNTPNGSLGLCISSTRRAGKCYGGSFNQGFGVLGLTMKTTDLNYFVQDDWRVSPRLTLNLGLRYEYQRNPEPFNQNPLLPQTDNSVDDRNNFGPRLGFAWDVNGDGKTSIRGGWGLYYGRVINSTIYNTLVNTGVGTDRGQRQFTNSATSLAGCSGSTADNCATLPIYPNLLPATNPPVGAIQFFSPDFQLPQIHQWDAVLEREIARNTVVSASYLGSYGNSLPNFVDTNLPAPLRNVNLNIVGGPLNGQTYSTPIFVGPRPNPAFQQLTEIRSNVYSKYHALVLQANRRMTNGLQFQTNYTLSRAMDNGQTSTTFTANNTPFNAFDQPNEKALSSFDRRQKFVASVVYSPNPFKDGAAKAIFNGWTIAPILNSFSGQRYTGTISGSISPASFGLSGSTPGGGVNGSGGSSRLALLPRNFFKQPNIWYLDGRLSRRFSLSERMRVEVLAEGFNLFNRTQVTGVNSTFYTLSGSTLTFNAPFGATTGADSTLFRERQIQLAARFEF